MGSCVQCSKYEARLKKGSICKDCFNLNNKDSVKKKGDSTSTNDVTNYTSLFVSNGNTLAANNNDNYSMNTKVPNSLTEDFLNTSVSQLSVRDIVKIITAVNEPLQKKLLCLIEDIGNKVKILDNRIELLEAENIKKEEDNKTLRLIVTNMQRCLNKLDADERNNNVIISGLPEREIKVDDNEESAPIIRDHNKISWIMILL